MAVRIRMQRFGRAHRPYFRICAIDQRKPRDGRAIEQLGHYDPMVKDQDARVVLKNDRIDYWLAVGAQPSEKVAVLIRKYGTNGTHLELQSRAMERLSMPVHSGKSRSTRSSVRVSKSFCVRGERDDIYRRTKICTGNDEAAMVEVFPEDQCFSIHLPFIGAEEDFFRAAIDYDEGEELQSVRVAYNKSEIRDAFGGLPERYHQIPGGILCAFERDDIMNNPSRMHSLKKLLFNESPALPDVGFIHLTVEYAESAFNLKRNGHLRTIVCNGILKHQIIRHCIGFASKFADVNRIVPAIEELVGSRGLQSTASGKQAAQMEEF